MNTSHINHLIQFQFKHYTKWIIIKCKMHEKYSTRVHLWVDSSEKETATSCRLSHTLEDDTSENRLSFWSIWNAPHTVPLLYYSVYDFFFCGSQSFVKTSPLLLSMRIYSTNFWTVRSTVMSLNRQHYYSIANGILNWSL